MRQYEQVLALSLLWLAQAAIEIAGGGGCPEPAAVSRSLRSLLPPVLNGATSAPAGAPGAAPPPAPSVRLSRTFMGDLDILFVGPDGRQLDERHLEGGSTCDDLAAAAAVVIATWVSEPELPLPQRVDLPRPAAGPATREPSASAGRRLVT